MAGRSGGEVRRRDKGGEGYERGPVGGGCRPRERHRGAAAALAFAAYLLIIAEQRVELHNVR